MTPDGIYTAVVDRFEDDLAVVLLEDDGDTVDQAVLDTERLPEDARHVDAVVSVELEDEEVIDITYEERETVDRSEQAQRRFDELSQRPRHQRTSQIRPKRVSCRLSGSVEILLLEFQQSQRFLSFCERESRSSAVDRDACP